MDKSNSKKLNSIVCSATFMIQFANRPLIKIFSLDINRDLKICVCIFRDKLTQFPKCVYHLICCSLFVHVKNTKNSLPFNSYRKLLNE